MQYQNSFLDGMMGLAIGDALGVPVEFLAREEIMARPEGPVTDMEAYGTHFQPAGTWSDDTSMALATLESLIDKKGIDLDHIMSSFECWYRMGEFTPYGQVFDIGGTCARAIAHYHANIPAERCGITGEHANGNGALMRILPVCLYLLHKTADGTMTDAAAIQQLHQVAGLTHDHLRSHTACGITFFMMRSILALKGTGTSLRQALQMGFDQASAFYTMQGLDGEFSHYQELKDLRTLAEKPVDKVLSGGYVVETLLAAIWSLVSTASFPEAVLAAVNLGHDTDTVGAVAGGFAGLWYGYDAIPAGWVATLADNSRFIKDCEAMEALIRA